MIDLRRPLRIHIVGIGGAGMSAIAEILIGTGHTVSGSDLQQSVVVERLVARGVEISLGHAAENVPAVDLVTHSTAIPEDNPELVEARRRGVPVLRRADTLAEITKAWRTVAVAGTHGKTTTSAMLTAALTGAGMDPAYIVGGDLRDQKRGAAVGSGEFLVVEADESDGTFVRLEAEAVIVTNVEPDHLEHYGGFDKLQDAFVRFVTQAPGPRVLCADDPGSARLAETHRGIRPGHLWHQRHRPMAYRRPASHADRGELHRFRTGRRPQDPTGATRHAQCQKRHRSPRRRRVVGSRPGPGCRGAQRFRRCRPALRATGRGRRGDTDR